MSVRIPNPVHGLQLLAAAAWLVLGTGCVREVLKGEDPESRAGRLTGDDRRDSLVVRLPWMGMPQPRLLSAGKLVRTETVFARTDRGDTRFTLRTPGGTTATVDATSQELPDGSMEFTYSIGSLPQGLIVDVAVPILGNGLRPDIDLAVNGAPVKMDPGTEVAAVQLARDAATRITATARRPAPAAPNAEAKP